MYNGIIEYIYSLSHMFKESLLIIIAYICTPTQKQLKKSVFYWLSAVFLDAIF